MKATLYSLDGVEVGKIDLPHIFSEQIRPDLINRAFLALKSKTRQKKGTLPAAGMQTSAEYIGRRRSYRAMINIGAARLPHEKLAKGGIGRVRRVPHSRGGRAAHPPKVEKISLERINKKERRKAIRSAIAATANADFVKKRGHRFDFDVPIIVEDKLSDVKKTKDLRAILSKLKLDQDLGRGKRKIKPGKGKGRGRRYKKGKSVLVVVAEDHGISKAGKNISGVDVCIAQNLNAELLAPGGAAGRLTVYTAGAVRELEKLFK